MKDQRPYVVEAHFVTRNVSSEFRFYSLSRAADAFIEFRDSELPACLTFTHPAGPVGQAQKG